MQIREVTTVGLGLFATFMLFLAAISTESGEIRGLGSALMVLFHFIIVMIALPFLLFSTYKSEQISPIFRWVITVLVILNAVLMLIASNAVSGDKTIYFVGAILELLPLWFLRSNASKVASM